MGRRYPYKNEYDPAPYEALAAEHRAGVDITKKVEDLIDTTRARPGHMAKRLNLVGIPAPGGGEWTWQIVQNTRLRMYHLRRVLQVRGWRVGSNGQWGLVYS